MCKACDTLPVDCTIYVDFGAKADAAWFARERWVEDFASAYRAQADEIIHTNSDVAWARLADFEAVFEVLSPIEQHRVSVLSQATPKNVFASEFDRMVAASAAANARAFG